MKAKWLEATNDPGTLWARGNYDIVGANLQDVADRLCHDANFASGNRVLDVGAGTGNATISAARLGCHVTGLDVSKGLLDRAKDRALNENLNIELVVGSAEDLPFPDASFDAVVSTFGVMFAPDHKAAAAEILRVCCIGGKIALANWSPDGVFGASGKAIGEFLPPGKDARAPALWGKESYLLDLFGQNVVFEFSHFTVPYQYANVDEYLTILTGSYPPLINTMAKLDRANQDTLRGALRQLYSDHNIATDGTFKMPMAYLQAIGRVE